MDRVPTKLLKKECIKILDIRGWDNKYKVDLRNRFSMQLYLIDMGVNPSQLKEA